jgi:hypothetical protein
VITVLSWFATIYAGTAVVANRASPSAAERLVWAPVSIVMLALALAMMLRMRAAR